MLLCHETHFVNHRGFSAYELVFLKDPPNLLDWEFPPMYEGLSLPAKQYLQLMEGRFNLIKKIVIDQKIREQNMQYYRDKRMHPQYQILAVGDLVCLDSEYCSDLKTTNAKLKKRWIAPLKIQAVLDDSHYFISDWNGEVPAISMYIHRLKPYRINMGLIKDGQLVTVSTVRQLFSHIKEMRDKSHTLKPQECV